jgi:hypothetical protein
MSDGRFPMLGQCVASSPEGLRLYGKRAAHVRCASSEICPQLLKERVGLGQIDVYVGFGAF